MTKERETRECTASTANGVLTVWMTSPRGPKHNGSYLDFRAENTAGAYSRRKAPHVVLFEQQYSKSVMIGKGAVSPRRWDPVHRSAYSPLYEVRN